MKQCGHCCTVRHNCVSLNICVCATAATNGHHATAAAAQTTKKPSPQQKPPPQQHQPDEMKKKQQNQQQLDEARKKLQQLQQRHIEEARKELQLQQRRHAEEVKKRLRQQQQAQMEDAKRRMAEREAYVEAMRRQMEEEREKRRAIIAEVSTFDSSFVASWFEKVGRAGSRDCNPGIPAIFVDPESRDWRRFNPGISGSQKSVKIVLFRTPNDRNKNFSRLMNKIFYKRQVLLCAV